MLYIIGTILLAVFVSVVTSRINAYIDFFIERRKQNQDGK